MKAKQAFKLLLEGKRIRNSAWDEDVYLYVEDDNILCCGEFPAGNPLVEKDFKITISSNIEWEEYNPKPKYLKFSDLKVGEEYTHRDVSSEHDLVPFKVVYIGNDYVVLQYIDSWFLNRPKVLFDLEVESYFIRRLNSSIE